MPRCALALWFFWIVSASAALPHVDRALAISFGRDDFPALSHGVETGYLTQPFRGEVRGSTMGEFRFDALQYAFSLRDLALTPQHGVLHVALNLRDASIHFNTLFIRQNIQCVGLRATSFSNAIPVSLDVVPALSGQGLRFDVRNVRVDVNSRNFYFQSLQGCTGLGPLNSLVERIVLQTANTMQSKVQETIAAQIVAQAQSLNQAIGGLFSLNLALPLLKGPLASLLVGLEIYPSDLELEGDRAYLVVGARFPGTSLAAPSRPGLSLTDLHAYAPPGGESYLALSADLVNLALKQANQRGFFRVSINEQTQPAVAPFLNAAAIQSLIPDAAQRFEPELPLGVNIEGVDDIEVLARNTGVNKIELATRFDRLAVGTVVAGKPYYDFTISGTIPLNLHLSAGRQHLLFTLPSLKDIALIDAAFAPGLQPPPAPGSGMTQATLDDYMVQLASLLVGNDDSSALVDLRLPPVNIGYSQILYRDLSVRAPFVAVGFQVWR